jgi:hypothetical protein
MKPRTVSIKAILESAKAAIEAAENERENMTAVMRLMTDLKEFDPLLFDVYTEKGRKFVNNFYKYLEIERNQIMSAHDAGACNYQGGIDNFNHFNDDNHYYNEMYHKNKLFEL